VGVEPTNNGFANRRLRPLGYAAGTPLCCHRQQTRGCKKHQNLTYFTANKHLFQQTPLIIRIFLKHFDRINVYIIRKIGYYSALFLFTLVRKLLNLRVLLKPTSRRLLLKTERERFLAFFYNLLWYNDIDTGDGVA
jgi:hypothetical protein